MKKVIFLGLIIWLIIAACGKQNTRFLQGAWQMVQMQRIDAGKVTNYFSAHYSVSQTKMWSENRFIFVGKYVVDTTITYRYGVGTYTLNGNLYTEDILYHFVKSYEGMTNRIWLELRGDTLLHIFPVDERGKPDPARHWVEKYVRIK
jgi:hypothetical protein